MTTSKPQKPSISIRGIKNPHLSKKGKIETHNPAKITINHLGLKDYHKFETNSKILKQLKE